MSLIISWLASFLQIEKQWELHLPKIIKVIPFINVHFINEVNFLFHHYTYCFQQYFNKAVSKWEKVQDNTKQDLQGIVRREIIWDNLVINN